MANQLTIKQLEEGRSLYLQFEKRGGLLPVTVQELSSGHIIMMGSLNKEAFEKTIRTKKATFWSTSRNELWTKGETSGNYMTIKEILVDCDQDALVFQVELVQGGACHTVNRMGVHRKGCFYRKYQAQEDTLEFIKGQE